MLRSRHALDIDRVGEIAEILVGLADAIMLRMVAVLDVSHTPGIVAYQLEGAAALSHLVALEAHIVVIHRSTPTMSQVLARGSEDASLATLLLDEHVVQAIALQIVDVGVDGGIAPIEKQARGRNLGETLVGMTIIHAVVFLLRTVEHGVINHISALLAILPHEVWVPKYLRGPYTIDGLPVLVRRLRLACITEVGHTIAEVEGDALPMNQVIASKQVDAIVVPLVALGNTHVGGHHQVALPIMGTGDIGITSSTLDTSMLLGVEDRLALIDVLIIVSITRNGESCIFPLVTHVAIEITIISFL